MFGSFQKRSRSDRGSSSPPQASSSPASAIAAPPAPSPVPPAPRATVGSFLFNVVTPMWKKVEEVISPRVVQPSERGPNKSWASSSGVISAADLTQYERIRLNAMEERVLPADVRIKIVFAQANAREREEEIEADVKRLDGLVRTLALYGILERNTVDSSKLDKLAPDRERELGKMLVAAVQLELFQMLDDICESGDVENELFDDLCTDTIQDGRRAGFFYITVELLLSPGSGYKRLLQIRKDQIVEKIAEFAGLRAFAGHDCQRDLSPSASPKSGSSVHCGARGAMDSDCGSPGSSAAGGDGGSGLTGLQIGGHSAFANTGGIGPSPSSHKPDSRSPSPEMGHRRTQTQRVRDLLSSIDGLVMESEQMEPEEALVHLPPLSPELSSNNRHETTGSSSGATSGGGAGAGPTGDDDARSSERSGGRSLSVRSKRRSTGGVDFRGGRSARLSLRTPPLGGGGYEFEGGGEGEEEDDRSLSRKSAFFPNERDWRGRPFPASTPPSAMGSRRSSANTAVPGGGNRSGEEEEGEGAAAAASADMLLAEVDWLIAGTEAALGGDLAGSDGLAITPDKREFPEKNGEDVPDLAGAMEAEGKGEKEEKEEEEAEGGRYHGKPTSVNVVGLKDVALLGGSDAPVDGTPDEREEEEEEEQERVLEGAIVAATAAGSATTVLEAPRPHQASSVSKPLLPPCETGIAQSTLDNSTRGLEKHVVALAPSSNGDNVDGVASASKREMGSAAALSRMPQVPPVEERGAAVPVKAGRIGDGSAAVSPSSSAVAGGVAGGVVEGGNDNVEQDTVRRVERGRGREEKEGEERETPGVDAVVEPAVERGTPRQKEEGGGEGEEEKEGEERGEKEQNGDVPMVVVPKFEGGSGVVAAAAATAAAVSERLGPGGKEKEKESDTGVVLESATDVEEMGSPPQDGLPGKRGQREGEAVGQKNGGGGIRNGGGGESAPSSQGGLGSPKRSDSAFSCADSSSSEAAERFELESDDVDCSRQEAAGISGFARTVVPSSLATTGIPSAVCDEKSLLETSLKNGLEKGDEEGGGGGGGVVEVNGTGLEEATGRGAVFEDVEL